MTDNLPSRFGQCLRSVSLWHAHSLLGFIIGNHLAQAPSEREEGRQRRNPINLPILFFSLRFCVPCFALSHRGRFSKKINGNETNVALLYIHAERENLLLGEETLIFMSFSSLFPIFFRFFLSSSHVFLLAHTGLIMKIIRHILAHGQTLEQIIFFSLWFVEEEVWIKNINSSFLGVRFSLFNSSLPEDKFSIING